MAPKIPCPNCQEDEWLENNELSYLPQVMKLKNGKLFWFKSKNNNQAKNSIDLKKIKKVN